MADAPTTIEAEKKRQDLEKEIARLLEEYEINTRLKVVGLKHTREVDYQAKPRAMVNHAIELDVRL
jgi:hypothetical protein